MNGTQPDTGMDFVMRQGSDPFVPFHFMRGIAVHRSAGIVGARFGSMLGRLIAMILISAPAGAADFGGSDFGAPCDAAIAHERARGSLAIPWNTIPAADIYVFSGREYNRDLGITYFCPKGTLARVNYLFPIEHPEKTISSYRDVYDVLISVYGAPFFDTTPWQVGGNTKDPSVISPDPQKYMTSWRTPLLDVNMTIGLDSESQGWRVLVVMDQRNN
jgi:hypothetical protein